MIARGVLQDLYVEGDVAAVFVEEQVVVLSEIASQVLLAVPETGPTEVSVIAEALVARYGEPPQESGVEAAQRIVDELVEHAILVLT